MIYLYAVTHRGPLHAVHERGLEDAPVYGSSCRDLVAVISTLSISELLPTPKRMWRHEQIVEDLMNRDTVLPVRFGTLFSHEAALMQVLSTHHDRFVDELDRLKDCVEIGVRVHRAGEKVPLAHATFPEQIRSNSKNGHTYLLTRLDVERKRQAMLEQNKKLAMMLDALLRDLTVDRSLHVSMYERMPFKAAYLVKRDSIDDFRSAVIGLAAAHSELHVLCTGPWPPYHFVNSVRPV